MLDEAERKQIAETFQVAGDQVARDHLISHPRSLARDGT